MRGCPTASHSLVKVAVLTNVVHLPLWTPYLFDYLAKTVQTELKCCVVVGPVSAESSAERTVGAMNGQQ